MTVSFNVWSTRAASCKSSSRSATASRSSSKSSAQRSRGHGRGRMSDMRCTALTFAPADTAKLAAVCQGSWCQAAGSRHYRSAIKPRSMSISIAHDRTLRRDNTRSSAVHVAVCSPRSLRRNWGMGTHRAS